MRVTVAAGRWRLVLVALVGAATLLHLMLVLSTPPSSDSAEMAAAHARAHAVPVSAVAAGGRRPPPKAPDPAAETETGTIHIAMICAGYNTSTDVLSLFKSLLFYRTQPLHLHLVVDDTARLKLQLLLATFAVEALEVDLYPIEPHLSAVEWVPNHHYGGFYALCKLRLLDILPASLARVIVLDTDVLVLEDIAELWGFFATLLDPHPAAAFAVVENLSGWYIPGIILAHPWPAPGQGVNTGVMLVDLERLRGYNWADLWPPIVRKIIADPRLHITHTHLADQDIINAILKDYPDMYRTLPCRWNAQLSENTLAAECFEQAAIIHWNSPKKHDVDLPQQEFYLARQHLFDSLDGQFLRHFRPLSKAGSRPPEVGPVMDKLTLQPASPFFFHRRLGADLSSTATHPATAGLSFAAGNPACAPLVRAASTIYRVLPYAIPFDDETFGRPNAYAKSHAKEDVTLVTQLSMSRLEGLENIMTHWDGPISAAIFLSDADLPLVLAFAGSAALRTRPKNVGLHLVFRENVRMYPVNYLRNVAVRMASTSHLFLFDVDFVPQPGLHGILTRHLALTGRYSPSLRPKALVVPAFQTSSYKLELPDSKESLKALLDFSHGSGIITRFRFDVWAQGHAPTDYERWLDAHEPYSVEWQPDFEPYIVLDANSVPLYDTRFSGFGWNKVSHIMELAARKCEFIVLPDTYMIHLSHFPSLDIADYRRNKGLRQCLANLKSAFQTSLPGQ